MIDTLNASKITLIEITGAPLGNFPIIGITLVQITVFVFFKGWAALAIMGRVSQYATLSLFVPRSWAL